MGLLSFSFISDTVAAPIQPDMVKGSVSLPGWQGLGRVQSAAISASTEFSLQAMVSNPTTGTAWAGVSATLAVEFAPGTDAPEFHPFMVNSVDQRPDVFVGPFGFGNPFAYAFRTEGPLAVPVPKSDFEIDVAFTGFFSPTLNGAPAIGSAMLNEALARAQVTYLVEAHDGTGGNDRVLGSAHADAVTVLQGDDRVAGRGGDDAILGGSGRDVLAGGSGDDRLIGGTGDDRLLGQTGNDNLNGGSGNDILRGAEGADRMAGGAGRDVLQGANGVDLLRGGSSADRLVGNAGDDTLHGGTGRDVMAGGAGDDVFQFLSGAESGREGRDVLLDFRAGSDRIDLRRLDADGAEDGDQAFRFLEGGWFSGEGRGELRLADTPDGQRVYLDTDGNGSADMLMDVRGVSGLTADAFML